MTVRPHPASPVTGSSHRDRRHPGSGLAAGLLGLLLGACSSPPPVPPPEPAVVRPPDYRRGLTVYQSHCANCHDGANVEAPPLDDIEAWDERSYEWQAMFRDHIARGFLTMPKAEELSEENINDALFYMEIRVRAIEEQSRNTPAGEPAAGVPPDRG